MPRSWTRFSVAALVVGAEACMTPAPIGESSSERLAGCFRRIYADGPPGSGAGGVMYTLTTDAGTTRLLEVSPALLAGAGGPSVLDGTRVSVMVAPARDSTSARARTARVSAIRREPASSGASC